PSGNGLHLLACGKKPEGRCRKGQFECYNACRYLTMTGHRLEDSQERLLRRTNAIARVHAAIFAEDKPDTVGSTPAVSKPDTVLDDDDIIAKASRAKNGDLFSRLWAGNTSGYTSPSEADQALTNLLAFWAGKDSDRMDRLFRKSGLMRDKWEREDYRTGTISK